MSDRLNGPDLDRWITGNYGEDQFRSGPGEITCAGWLRHTPCPDPVCGTLWLTDEPPRCAGCDLDVTATIEPCGAWVYPGTACDECGYLAPEPDLDNPWDEMEDD